MLLLLLNVQMVSSLNPKLKIEECIKLSQDR